MFNALITLSYRWGYFFAQILNNIWKVKTFSLLLKCIRNESDT